MTTAHRDCNRTRAPLYQAPVDHKTCVVRRPIPSSGWNRRTGKKTSRNHNARCAPMLAGCATL